MKVEVKKVNSLKRELRFEVPKDRVSKAMDEVYTEIGKTAKVKGFRQGKVPRNVLEAEHGQMARDETLRKVVSDVYHEGIQQENLQPVDMPQIANVSFQDGIIKFTATLDVKPEINLTEADYKGIKVKRKPSEVTDEEINKTLEYFKKGQGDKDVTIDDAFARGLGYPDLEGFKKSLVRQMEMDKDRQNRADVENQIIEALLKKAKFDAPESLLRKQMAHRIEETKKRLKHQGMPEEEINKKVPEMEKEFKDPVEKDIKTYLLFDEIAQSENIQVDERDNMPAKVMELLMKEADWAS